MLRCTASFTLDGERYQARTTLVNVEHPAAAARPLDFEPAERNDRPTHERYLQLLERAKRQVGQPRRQRPLWGCEPQTAGGLW